MPWLKTLIIATTCSGLSAICFFYTKRIHKLGYFQTPNRRFTKTASPLTFWAQITSGYILSIAICLLSLAFIYLQVSE